MTQTTHEQVRLPTCSTRIRAGRAALRFLSAGSSSALARIDRRQPVGGGHLTAVEEEEKLAGRAPRQRPHESRAAQLLSVCCEVVSMRLPVERDDSHRAVELRRKVDGRRVAGPLGQFSIDEIEHADGPRRHYGSAVTVKGSRLSLV